MLQTNFDSYENVLIKRKKEASMTFLEIQRGIQSSMNEINERESIARHFQDS